MNALWTARALEALAARASVSRLADTSGLARMQSSPIAEARARYRTLSSAAAESTTRTVDQRRDLGPINEASALLRERFGADQELDGGPS
jgi:hypothetical protein